MFRAKRVQTKDSVVSRKTRLKENKYLQKTLRFANGNTSTKRIIGALYLIYTAYHPLTCTRSKRNQVKHNNISKFVN